MNSDLYLRYLLDDKLSLDKYFRQHKTVTLDDVMRSALLSAREYRYAVPDHYYRLGNEHSFAGITRLPQLFTVGLPHLAEEYLEMIQGKVKVRGNRLNDWQLLLTHIPPLILVTAYIWDKSVPFSIERLTDYAHDILLPSLRFTAILTANLPEMEFFKHEKGGFMDLHVHLNGTIETDWAWQDFIRYPNAVCGEISKSFSNVQVREQLAQMTGIESVEEFRLLFLIAGRLRNWLFEYILGKSTAPDNEFYSGSLELLFRRFISTNECWYRHPMELLFPKHTSPLILESIFYVTVLDYLSSYPANDVVASIFHYYLLILGLCNKLLVQQQNSFGFEQFQKYTSNNMREFSERHYMRRFFQLAGNDFDNVRHLEGRFSPKSTIEANVKAIDRIKKGYDRLVSAQKKCGVEPTTLSLVAHFIKKPEYVDEKSSVRYERLRVDVSRKADALIALLATHCSEAAIVKGVDAAASEFDAPPEVFAPCFQRLKACGIQHITFHAGEDFFHVLSGLRYVYEAMSFLKMSTGDRIGHATATGIDVGLWHRNIGGRIWIRRETYLDDLVFAYCLIGRHNDNSLTCLLPKIALKVMEYASQVYPDIRCNIHDLIEAWKLRQNAPKQFIDTQLVDKEPSSQTLAGRLFVSYHSREVREQGAKMVLVDVNEIFSDEDLTRLQQLVLEEMHGRQIVIETLPTSNVMIGHHHDFSTYHLYNWYQWSKQGKKIPAIVVGTDDAGIFATNIYNEYCHIYCQLVFDKGLAPQEAMVFIRQLSHNAEVYKF